MTPRRPSQQASLANLERRVRELERSAIFRLGAPQLWGLSVGDGQLSNGFSLFSGTLFVCDELGMPAGMQFGVDFSHARTGGSFWSWIGFRVHRVTTLTAENYRFTEAWESDPWNGGVGSYQFNDPYPAFGGYQGFVTAAAVTNVAGEVVTWTLPSGATQVEQYSFNAAAVGHIGYMFHDFGARDVGNLTAAFSAGSTERKGSIIWNKSPGAVSIGTVVAEDQGFYSTFRRTAALTEDIAPGDQLIVVSAARVHTDDAGKLTDALKRPTIIAERDSTSQSDLVPKWLDPVRGQLRELPIQPWGR